MKPRLVCIKHPPELLADNSVVEHREVERARHICASDTVSPTPPDLLSSKCENFEDRFIPELALAFAAKVQLVLARKEIVAGAQTKRQKYFSTGRRECRTM